MALLGVGAVGSRLPASRIGAVWSSVAGRAVGNHPAAWAGKEGVTKKDGGGTGLEVKSSDSEPFNIFNDFNMGVSPMSI